MTPTRAESYLRGYAEGGQAKRDSEWEASDQEVREQATKLRPPDILEEVFVWNLGFARGYRARDVGDESYAEIFNGLMGDLWKAYRQQNLELFESSMDTLQDTLDEFLKIV